MTKRRVILGVGVAMLLAVGLWVALMDRRPSPNPVPPLQESAAEGRTADAQYFVDEFARLQVDLFDHVDEDDYWSRADAIVDGADAMSNGELWIELYRLTTPMESSHVDAFYVEPGLPVALQRFDDGYYLAYLPERLKEHIGARVEAICGLSQSELLENSRAIIGAENDIYRNWWLSRQLTQPAFADAVGCSDVASAGLDMTLEGGDTIVVADTDEEMVGQRIELPVDVADPEALYWYAPVGDAMYLRYRRCVGEPEFKALMADFWSEVDRTSPDKIVVDVRSNAGGDSSILERWFIDEAKSRDRYLADGRIVALIDAETFSSGVLAGYHLADQVGATLVGGSTGGSVSGYGEVDRITMRNTQIGMSYTTAYIGDGTELNTLRPDIEIPLRGVDALEGRDPVLFEVLGVHNVPR